MSSGPILVYQKPSNDLSESVNNPFEKLDFCPTDAGGCDADQQQQQEQENQQGEEEEYNVDDYFQEDFERAKALLVSPQSLFEKLTLEKVAEAFLGLLNIWYYSRLPHDQKALRNFAAFVCPNPPYEFKTCSEEEIESIYYQIRLQWSNVMNYLDNCDVQEFNNCIYELTGEPTRHPSPKDALVTMSEISFGLRQVIVWSMRAEALCNGKMMHMLPDQMNYGKFSIRNNADLKPHQRVHLKILRKCNDLKLRKIGKNLFSEITTPVQEWIDAETGEKMRDGGFYTHAWQLKGSVEEFVGDFPHKDFNFQEWKDLTLAGSLTPICNMIEKLRDIELPELVKDRHYISFLDGIYHLTYDDFYSYRIQTDPETKRKVEELDHLRKTVKQLKEIQHQYRDFKRIEECNKTIKTLHEETRRRGSDLLPSSLATANYIDQNFIPSAFNNDFQEYTDQCPRWDSIFSAAYDRILDHQQFYHIAPGPQPCHTFKCKHPAQYSVRADAVPRYCAKHREEGMIDKLKSRCCIGDCENPATWWQSKDQARLRGNERQKYCDEHKMVGHERIPAAILDGGLDTAATLDQGDLSVKYIFCAMMGRINYNVGELDRWQVIPFLKGLANTGKSTLIKFFQTYYSPDDVQVLSNNIEKRFGLEPIVNKFLFVAPEIKDNFGLDQAEFQSMVSGDPMSVSRKFKLAQTMTWIVPGLLAGNTPPKWADKSGSITRRVLTFPFLCPVRVVDSALEDQLKMERGVILRKNNLAYHGLIEYMANQPNKNVWSVMPQKLLNAKEDLQMATSVLGYFLSQNNEIVVDTTDNRIDSFVPWDFFMEKLHAFNIRFHQPVLGNLDPREFTEVFAAMNVEMIFETGPNGKNLQKMWSGSGKPKKHSGPFLYGMTYKPLTGDRDISSAE